MIRIFNFLERFPFFPLSCSYSCSPLLPTLRTHTFHAMTLNFPGEEMFENFFIMKKKSKIVKRRWLCTFYVCLAYFFLFCFHSLGKKLRMLSYQDYFSLASETAFESQENEALYPSLAWLVRFLCNILS